MSDPKLDEVEDEAARLRRAEALLRSGWDGEVEDTEVEGLAQTSQVSETPQGFDAAGIERHAVERLEKCVQGYIHRVPLPVRADIVIAIKALESRYEAQQVAAREMDRVLAENKLLRDRLETQEKHEANAWLEVERLRKLILDARDSDDPYGLESEALWDEARSIRAALKGGE